MTRPARWWWAAAGAAVTAAWAAACLAGRPADALGRAAAAGAAAVVTAGLVPAGRLRTVGGVLLLGAYPAAMTRTPPLLVATAVVAAAVAWLDDGAPAVDPLAVPVRPRLAAAVRWVDRLLAPLGATLLAAGAAVTARDGLGWRLAPSGRPAAALLVAGAGALVAAARRPGLSPVLSLPALLAAAAAAPVLPHAAVAAGAGLVALAFAWRDHRGPALAALAVGPLALAATRPAGLLLGAAAVLVGVVPAPMAALAALPGVVALVGALSVQHLSTTTAAMAAGVALAAALVAWCPARRPWPGPLALAHVPAAALSAWLLVAPDTWRWAGRVGLRAYQRGAVLAVAGAALAVAVHSARLAWLRRYDPAETPID